MSGGEMVTITFEDWLDTVDRHIRMFYGEKFNDECAFCKKFRCSEYNWKTTLKKQ